MSFSLFSFHFLFHRLAEWVKNKADAEAERERRRKKKLERMARDPKHYFVDSNYDQQKQDVSESLEEAVTKGENVLMQLNSTFPLRKIYHKHSTQGIRSGLTLIIMIVDICYVPVSAQRCSWHSHYYYLVIIRKSIRTILPLIRLFGANGQLLAQTAWVDGAQAR